ncbi:MAG: hypothetical protein R2712_20590 [Vicinamibacterales bacterium]
MTARSNAIDLEVRGIITSGFGIDGRLMQVHVETASRLRSPPTRCRP